MEKVYPATTVERTNQLLEQANYHLARIDRGIKFLMGCTEQFKYSNAYDFTPPHQVENLAPQEARTKATLIEEILSGNSYR